MEDNEIRWKLMDFKRDFQLSDKEINSIVKPGTNGFEKRVRRMDRVRKAMRDAVKPEAMETWLFAYNKNLKGSYFNLMVQGCFDRVIEDIIALKEGVYV